MRISKCVSKMKENKFIVGLAAVTLLLGGGIVYFGLKAKGEVEEGKEDIDRKEAQLSKYKGLDPFPDQENAKLKELAVRELIVKAEEAQKKLLSFVPEKIEQIDDVELNNLFAAAVASAKEKFSEAGGVPDGFFLGFERYKDGGVPKKGATGYLAYQLKALKYVVDQAAESGVGKIRNLRRDELPPEAGQEWEVARGRNVGGKSASNTRRDRQSRSRRSGSQKNKKGVRAKRLKQGLPIARKMPFEISVQGREEAIAGFLERVCNSSEYFFQIKHWRIANLGGVPTSSGQSGGASSKSDFGGEGSGERILEKISGGDDLVLFLRAEILLFSPDREFPKFRSDKVASVEGE